MQVQRKTRIGLVSTSIAQSRCKGPERYRVQYAAAALDDVRASKSISS